MARRVTSSVSLPLFGHRQRRWRIIIFHDWYAPHKDGEEADEGDGKTALFARVSCMYE